MKVLLVEDNPATRRVLEEILENDPGIDVEGVPNGPEALEAVKGDEFDVVVLDYELPETNGVELLEPIRARDPSVAVVFLTGKGSESVARKALSQGAHEYLVKDDETYDRLPEVLRRVHSESPGDLIRLEDREAPRESPESQPSQDNVRALERFLERIPVQEVIVHAPNGDVVLSTFEDAKRAELLATRSSALLHQAGDLIDVAGTGEGDSVHLLRGSDHTFGIAGSVGHMHLMAQFSPDTALPRAIELVRQLAPVVRDVLDG